MKATEIQVGGNHYQYMKMQPVELFALTKCTAFQANIWKYIARYKQKNGEEDVRKAMHYAQLALELNCNGHFDHDKIEQVIHFCQINRLSTNAITVIIFAANDYYQGVIDERRAILEKEYPS